MNTKALRQKILDLAIHGKLVPQDPNDEPASVLLERIKAEKERLIKEGKIKRAKRSKAACDKPHYPYEVPEGWCWCKLEDIAYDLMYGTSEKSSSEGLVPVLRMGNINRMGEIDWNNLVYTSNQTDIAKYSLRHDDLLFNRTNSSEWVGKTAIYKGSRNAIYAGYIIRIRTISVNADYINYVMNSSYHRNWCNEVKTDAVNQSNINAQKLSQLYIPIPPYKEQQSIVNSVQRWVAFIDEIEKGKCNLTLSIERTKSKILDLAIHGKLVPQDPTDEPAAELLKRINPKAEIACDNAQYGKLPNGWCLVPLLAICDCYQPKTISTSQLNKNGRYPVYGANGIIGRYSQYNHKDEEVLLTCRGATCGEVNKSQPYSWINGNAMVIHPLCSMDCNFLFYLVQTFKKYEGLISGTAQPQITRVNLGNIFISLPPLNEQHRIVAKIEELFALLDRIASSL